MDNIVAARGIFQQMNPRELQVVFQEINQRLNFQRQGGFVPERLGQARSEPDLPTFVRPEGHETLPPVGRESRRDEERDVFSRSEKWLSSPPQSNHEIGNEPILARVGVVGQSGTCGIRSGNSPVC